MKYVIINKSGPFESAFKAGLFRAAQEAVACGSNEITLLVPKITSIGNVIEHVIGREAVKALEKKKSVTIIQGLSIRAESERTLGLSPRATILLAAYIPANDLKKVAEKLYAGKAMIYVPWMDGEAKKWKSLYNPEVVEIKEGNEA